MPGRLLVTAAAAALAGCATLQQMAALRSVTFAIDRVAEVRLAGIDVGRVAAYRDLGVTDAARLGAAVASGALPLSFRVHLTAENPADNRVTARLVRLRWTLLIEDRETIGGLVDQEVVLPPGEPQDVPVEVELDLLRFVQRTGPDLFRLAQSLAGGGEPTQVVLRAQPTVQTPLGPIDYPRPITIVSKEVGR